MERQNPLPLCPVAHVIEDDTDESVEGEDEDGSYDETVDQAVQQ